VKELLNPEPLKEKLRAVYSVPVEQIATGRSEEILKLQHRPAERPLWSRGSGEG